jgi:hypothetical protein
MIDRLESFFAEDLPTNMEVLPTTAPEASAPPRVESAEGTGVPVEAKGDVPKDEGARSSAYAAVRLVRTAAKDAITRSQDAFREIEANLKNHAQEFEKRHAALSSATETASANLQQLQEKAAKDIADELEKVSQPLLARSAQQLQEQGDAAVAALHGKLDAERLSFVAETEKQFETLRASRQLFIEDTQKQLAATAQPSIESLTRVAVERTLADLDAFRPTFISETQTQLVSASQPSLELLSQDLSKKVTEQVQANLAASLQTFLQETQNQLAQMIEASQQQLQTSTASSMDKANAAFMASRDQVLGDAREQVVTIARASIETEVKNGVEQARKELRDMADSFLAKAVPQIEAELEKLVGRRMEAVHAQPAPPPVAPLRAAAQAAGAQAGGSLIASSLRMPSSIVAPRDVSSPGTSSQAAASQAVPAQMTPPRTAPAQVTPSLSLGVSRPAPVRAEPQQGNRLEFRLAESAAKPRVNRRALWEGITSGLKLGLILGVVAIFGFLVYFFASPVIRLRANPPAAFFDDNPSWTAKQRAAENQLARAYWGLAVNNIETKYGFGSTLPADPPDEFAVESVGTSGATSTVDPAARARYWEKLRELWPQPDSWERGSDRGVNWIRSAWDDASWKISQLFNSSSASAAPAP